MRNLIKNSLIIFGCISFSLFAVTPESASKVNPAFTIISDDVKNNPDVKDFFEASCNKNPTVVEFFSYACHGCSLAEPAFNKYSASKPSNVEFKRIPVTFNYGWDVLAKVYYTNEHLGLTKELHDKVFAWSLNTLKSGKAITNDSIKAFITEQVADASSGLKSKVTVDDYMATFNSPTVNRDYEKANRLMRTFDIRSTPCVIVNNKYKVTLDKNSHEDMIKIIQKLTKENTRC